MTQIFIECSECGLPNVIEGADPSLVDRVRSSSDVEKCVSCGQILDNGRAYAGRWSDDGKVALPVA